MEVCALCYPARLPAGDSHIEVISSIVNFQNYWYKITDKFGNIYTGECTPSYSNSTAFIIDPADLPDNLLNPYAGAFTLQVVNPYDVPQSFSFGGQLYGCVSMEFYNETGDDIHPRIQ